MDLQSVQSTLRIGEREFSYVSLPKLTQLGFEDVATLPFSIKVLLESALRNCDDYKITKQDIATITQWSAQAAEKREIAFKPGRVILQDFTGVPCVVDLAAMRDGMRVMGGDQKKINPQVQCDLIIDHSVQTDFAAQRSAFKRNLVKEFQRNHERYRFLKWGQQAFKNFRVIPPSTGIIHQINLEYLAQGVLQEKRGKISWVYPDSVIGTDSHTTMINGLGIVGWGVGGIEAEAVMLGEPLSMVMPQVIGFKLTGRLSASVTPTDLVLHLVQILRKEGVVDKFIEYFGDGLKDLPLPTRAMIANMAPEYGATIGFFPVDAQTLSYYRLTGRSKAQVELIEKYYNAQGMFYDGNSLAPRYTKILSFDLGDVRPCVAGPRRPQEKVLLPQVPESFQKICQSGLLGKDEGLRDGSVVIASITSCTNTSDPFVLMAAGLLARNAVKRGLKVKSFVKTSFAPGSRAATLYLKSSGLLRYLEKLGFHVAGYGCMTCIGNSGPLDQKTSKIVKECSLSVASVLSGNRNFEGRINPLVKANYLASPPLVIAYALAGNVQIDLTCKPLGQGKNGKDVFLSDLWPSEDEIQTYIKRYVQPQVFRRAYKDVLSGPPQWKKISAKRSEYFSWDPKSTYIQEPPFFKDTQRISSKIDSIENARALAVLGDSITTDHISPAGNIAVKSPAGQYLLSLGVSEKDFNSYGARRGNDRVMTRGTFANIRLKNLLVPEAEGSWTICFVNNEPMDIFAAAMRYAKDHVPLLVIAGKEYGTGSSRDWAAKGTALLGVKAVIAESFERIHRSNLVGMGVLPLQFLPGESRQTIGLRGNEVFDIYGLSDSIKPQEQIKIHARDSGGQIKVFHVLLRLDTYVELDYYRRGGILPAVLQHFVK